MHAYIIPEIDYPCLKIAFTNSQIEWKSYLTLNKPKSGLIYFYLDYHKMYLQQQNMREAWYVWTCSNTFFPLGSIAVVS
jgi:hypothetical protein